MIWLCLGLWLGVGAMAGLARAMTAPTWTLAIVRVLCSVIAAPLAALMIADDLRAGKMPV